MYIYGFIVHYISEIFVFYFIACFYCSHLLYICWCLRFFFILSSLPRVFIEWSMFPMLVLYVCVNVIAFLINVYTLKTEVLKITLEASFLTLPKSTKRDNTRSVTETPREVSRS